MKRTVWFAVVSVCLAVAGATAAAVGASPAPPALTAPARIVYGDRARLHATVAAGSLPATFSVERSFDGAKWSATGQRAAITDTRTTAVDLTVVPEGNSYWRIAERSGDATLTSNAARILVSAKLSGPYLSNPLYFGKPVSIHGQIFPAFPVGSTAVRVVVRRWSNGKWVQDAILPARILPNAGKATGHDWQVTFTPTATQIGCTVAFYAVHSDPTRVSGGTPSVYRKVLCPAGAKVVALTFDDGPWPSQTQAVLDILKANGVRATFFQVGQCVDARPQLSRTLLANGMLLGNHTETHLLLGKRSYSTAYAEIANGQASIRNATSFTPRWFRPPGGSTSGTVEDAAAKLGMRTILWSVDPRDWERPSVTTICSRVLDNVRPGAVVLMHDGGGSRSSTIGALEPIVRALKRQGYTFLTLDQMPGADGTGRYPL